MRTGDTIVAIASPAGRSARGLIRLSGPGLGGVMAEAFGSMPPVGASEGRLRLSPHSLPVLVTRYASPRSYTGEDGAEILLPGNPFLLERVLARLLSLPGVRLAEPGEFTARAYLAGKLSLDQAEGVAATIAAASEEQLRAAGELLAGSTGAAYRAWADDLATLLALVEAGIDFTDQEDVVPIPPRELRRRLGTLDEAIRAFVGSSRGGEARTALPRVVLAGEPNAGKSTLFNALLGRRRAVVSPAAGTTRDALEEPLDLSGALPGAGTVLLVDVAGFDADAESAAADSTEPRIHLDMQRRAREAVTNADAVVHCDPSGKFPALSVPADTTVIRVRTKADLPHAHDDRGAAPGIAALPVCALDGWNLPVLRRAIADAACGSRSGGVAAILPRHRRALAETRVALRAGIERTGDDAGALSDPAAVADALRAALDALGELTGRISPDDVIGRVFATFCVGK